MKVFVSSATLIMILSGAIFNSPVTAQPVPPVPPSITVQLPGRPFGVTLSHDQRWAIVSLDQEGPSQLGSLAVLENQGGEYKMRRILPMANKPMGMALTHDGELLVVTAQDSKQDGSVIFFDMNRLVMGAENPRHAVAPNIAYVLTGPGSGSIYANITADDKTLFISDEFANTISVINLESLRSRGLSTSTLLGRVPVGISPVALTFSRDGRWLYATSEVAPATWGWPQTLKRENGPGMVSEGAVIVIDVAKARTDPQNSVIARIPSGGSPVRLALSPDGSRLFVTARASNRVLVFDTEKLITNPSHSKLGSAPVGKAPVPIVLVDDGKTVVVGNSNRFGANANAASQLTLLDTRKIEIGADPIIGHVPAGAFPREFSLSLDGHTLFLTNYFSKSLQIFDVSQLPH